MGYTTNTKNALAASDYAIGVVKCETSSLNGAKDFQDTINTLGKIMEAMQDIRVEFGELAYKNMIQARDCIERYTKMPIDLENKLDHHDKNALQMYDQLLNEILEKVDIDYAKGKSESNSIF